MSHLQKSVNRDTLLATQTYLRAVEEVLVEISGKDYDHNDDNDEKKIDPEVFYQTASQIVKLEADSDATIEGFLNVEKDFNEEEYNEALK